MKAQDEDERKKQVLGKILKIIGLEDKCPQFMKEKDLSWYNTLHGIVKNFEEHNANNESGEVANGVELYNHYKDLNYEEKCFMIKLFNDKLFMDIDFEKNKQLQILFFVKPSKECDPTVILSFPELIRYKFSNLFCCNEPNNIDAAEINLEKDREGKIKKVSKIQP